jgi:RNA polymerase sigma-70 factor (ECF subfamily)
VAQGEEAPQLADMRHSPQEMLERAAWSAPLQQALAGLSPEFRAAVILCDAQGLSYEQASQVLRCPVGTVRSRLHRARDQLRAWLTQRPVPEEG